MTDTPPMPAPDGPQPQIRILAQFIRDLSFENPNAPDSLRATETPPNIDLGVEMNAKGRPDGFYEVDLKLTARALRADATVFQIELLYGGLFELNGFAEDQLELVLLIECPRFLFPFARRIVSDMTAEGGFPPLHLEPIDFGAVYAAQRAQAGALSEPTVGNA
ncbi:protein-export chaperone SecB [Caulobacter sp. S45]|jgi:preprotein translocase subunit SecB|uniref:protein-export chaperone SecB n=1 Tax=Caulobacter sp. S45 TaxID=1641861 RepID=UPI00131DD44B|nr:protein-export chaperone SecB [Caulobacter sp. S45]